MDTKKLIEIKQQHSKRKPYFLRQCTHKLKALKIKWRKPKGLHSKLKNAKAGHSKSVKVGYRAPAVVRTMHPSGLFPVAVSNVADLGKISGGQGALVSSTVGLRKKLQIVDEAKKKNIAILNIKEIEKFVEQANALLEKRKQARKEMLEGKEKKKAKKKKKEEKKEEPKEEKTVEEKKVEEKKEKDKILTSKQ
ncbi:50S ribosomal protein L32e [Candidatus Woesearchaeota archaeon]|nr:50S ribosomal protein L32e [Candidatus Woesearchaeota archaeon]MBW3017427.1 50S ribosomal protein L32e [Candidatus Woesearchaeota archaeon]